MAEFISISLLRQEESQFYVTLLSLIKSIEHRSQWVQINVKFAIITNFLPIRESLGDKK